MFFLYSLSFSHTSFPLDLLLVKPDLDKLIGWGQLIAQLPLSGPTFPHVPLVRDSLESIVNLSWTEIW